MLRPYICLKPKVVYNMGFVEELKWRGMLQDIMPGTEDLLKTEVVSGYIGFDPTADSLGVGNLGSGDGINAFSARGA